MISFIENGSDIIIKVSSKSFYMYNWFALSLFMTVPSICFTSKNMRMRNMR